MYGVFSLYNGVFSTVKAAPHSSGGGGQPTWSYGTRNYLCSTLCLCAVLSPDRKVNWRPKAWQQRKTFTPKLFHADSGQTDKTLLNTARIWTSCYRWASLTTEREYTVDNWVCILPASWGSRVSVSACVCTFDQLELFMAAK